MPTYLPSNTGFLILIYHICIISKLSAMKKDELTIYVAFSNVLIGMCTLIILTHLSILYMKIYHKYRKNGITITNLPYLNGRNIMVRSLKHANSNIESCNELSSFNVH